MDTRNLWRVLAAIALLWPASAGAQQALPGDVLARLGSDDFVVREAASQELLKMAQPDVEALGRLFRDASLPEQRHRLRSVIEHHVMAKIIRERFNLPSDGAIGLQHQEAPAEQLPGLGRPAIRVVATYPGFPGYVHTRVGDLILAVDGREILVGPGESLIERFRDLIKVKRSGEQITLRILRDGEVVTERFTLSSLDALNQVYNQTALAFNNQALIYAQRRRELQRVLGGGEHEPQRLEVTLPTGEEASGDGQTRDDRQRRADTVLRQFRPGVVVLEHPEPVEAPSRALERVEKLLEEIEKIELGPPRP